MQLDADHRLGAPASSRRMRRAMSSSHARHRQPRRAAGVGRASGRAPTRPVTGLSHDTRPRPALEREVQRRRRTRRDSVLRVGPLDAEVVVETRSTSREPGVLQLHARGSTATSGRRRRRRPAARPRRHRLRDAVRPRPRQPHHARAAAVEVVRRHRLRAGRPSDASGTVSVLVPCVVQSSNRTRSPISRGRRRST